MFQWLILYRCKKRAWFDPTLLWEEVHQAIHLARRSRYFRSLSKKGKQRDCPQCGIVGGEKDCMGLGCVSCGRVRCVLLRPVKRAYCMFCGAKNK